MERRLAAILAADVVGYSRLMGEDEAGTLTALKALRVDVIDPILTTHNGRIVKLMGDGILIEFASAVDAVTCALVLQAGLAERNRDIPEARQIVFRMGLNIGDLMVEGDDLYGDGVNVAARLEGLAQPGGLCLSANVYEQVRGKLDLAVEDLGPQTLKNIREPVRAFHVAGNKVRDANALDEQAPDRLPTIAVLSFTNMSGDPSEDYFSDGITEDIITELSRFRDLSIIARNSTFVYKGQAVDVKKVGRELGCDFVVEGSLRKAGQRIRVTAQLIDVATGNHIWAERYDRELLDIFEVQEELTTTIAATAVGRIAQKEFKRSSRLKPDQLRAYDCVLQGLAIFLRLNKEDNQAARKILEQATRLDPENAQACAYQAACHILDWNGYWSQDRADTAAQALRLAQRAVALDDTNPRNLWPLGEVYLYMQRDHERAAANLEKAVRLNPNDMDVLLIYGLYLIAVGKHEDAIDLYSEALKRDPFGRSAMAWFQGTAYFSARRYGEAIAVLQPIEDPINEARIWLAASYAKVGRLQEAQATTNDFLNFAAHDMVMQPSSWAHYIDEITAYQNPDDLAHLLAALKLAGLPD